VLGLHLDRCPGLHLLPLHRLYLLCPLPQYEHQRQTRPSRVSQRVMSRSLQPLQRSLWQRLQPMLNPQRPQKFQCPRKLLSCHKLPRSLHLERLPGKSKEKQKHQRLRRKQKSLSQTQLRKTCPKQRALLRRIKLRHKQLPRKSHSKNRYKPRLLLQLPRLRPNDSLQVSSTLEQQLNCRRMRGLQLQGRAN
jgi:hypothetical protein